MTPRRSPRSSRTGNITYITIDLAQRAFESYYGGFANRTLWPLFHYRLDLSSFDRDWYVGYRQVNQLFAEQLYPYLRDDDLVWVHDYHLIPMAEELRRLGVKCRLGFFLHIPFPSTEVYVALPWHDQLVQAHVRVRPARLSDQQRPAQLPRLPVSRGDRLRAGRRPDPRLRRHAPGAASSRSGSTPTTSPRWRPRPRRCAPASGCRAA